MRKRRSSRSETRICGDELSDLFEVLNDRERNIIFQRFGLDGDKPRTLEEVGKKFGVTRERIRQLQNIALAKLRQALSKKEMPTYLYSHSFNKNSGESD
jgi:RNA polymerase sigma factor (sigma-70 family)